MKKEKHSKPPQSRNFVINILIIICIIVIIFSLYNIGAWFIENKKGTDLISNIQSQVTITSEDISVNNLSVKKLNYDFTNLLSENSRTVGWVNVKNTNINYPVVKYTDNDYYLNHSFEYRKFCRMGICRLSKSMWWIWL